METQQQIDILESRQLELRAIMAKSDDRAAKCSKSGLDFRATYPLDYEAVSYTHLTLPTKA